MRIRNISRAKLVFNGGEIAPDEEIIIKDEEKAKRLLARNPKMLIEVGAAPVRVIDEAPVVEEKAAEEVKAPAKAVKKAKK